MWVHSSLQVAMLKHRKDKRLKYIVLSSRGRCDRPGVPLHRPQSSLPCDSSSLHHQQCWQDCHQDKQIPAAPSSCQVERRRWKDEERCQCKVFFETFRLIKRPHQRKKEWQSEIHLYHKRCLHSSKVQFKFWSNRGLEPTKKSKKESQSDRIKENEDKQKEENHTEVQVPVEVQSVRWLKFPVFLSDWMTVLGSSPSASRK